MVFGFSCFGQTKYNLETKHQLGISSAKFFALFNESVDNLGLSYRYHTQSGLNYRAGLSYELNTADDGSFEGGLKLGVDKYFRNYNQWRFYYGVEASFASTMLFSSNRNTTKYGGSVLFGAILYLGPHFSLSTEPQFSVIRVLFRDEDSFSADANREWFEFKLKNLGHIQASFHF